MRKLMALAALLAATGSALAEDVLLEAKNLDLKAPLIGQRKAIRFEKAPKPDGAVAPEGVFLWGKLIVGTTEHWMCVSQGEKTCVFLDADGDMDLAEETPIEGSVTAFGEQAAVLEGVPGSIALGDAKFDFKMTLLAIPRVLVGAGIVPVCTVFAGRAKVGGVEVEIAWIPGEAPAFSTGFSALGFIPITEVFTPDSKVTAANDVSLSGGKPCVSVSSAKEEGLLLMDAPEGAAFLVFGNRGKVKMSTPGGGKMSIPIGTYQQGILAHVGKEDDGGRIELLSIMSPLKAAEGLKIGGALPLKATLENKASGGQLTFRPVLKDASGREYMLFLKREQAPPPYLLIVDSEGKEVLRHDFEHG